MPDTYAWLKFIHVLLAIIAVGFNASYAVWIARSAKEPEHEAHVLRGIKILDDRFANPSYGLLLVTGLLMVWNASIPLSTFWISTGIGIYAVVVILGAFVFTPTLRRQIAVLEAEGRSERYESLSMRGRIVGIVLAVLVVVIVFLMVAKPTP